MGISVVINTKNAAETLERTLKSVAWADEVIVADMQSVDNTVAIAKKYTKTIISVADYGYVEPARNEALAAAQHEWILLLDADEVITPELQKLIGATTDKASHDAYFVARKNIIFGAWVQHTGWWPDYVLRLFKNGTVSWSDEIHAVPVVRGTTGYLPAKESAAIVHYNYGSVSEFVERLDRYTTIQAQEKRHDTQKIVSEEQAWQVFADEFARRFFAEKGYKDADHGLFLSFLQAFSEVVVAAKTWEHASFPRSKNTTQLTGLNYCLRVFRYWRADWYIAHTSGVQQLYWRVRRKLYL